MNKLEEAARARLKAAEDREWEDISLPEQIHELEGMRAAIAVLREPSEAMARAWAAAGDGWKDGYVAMIDATEDE